MTHLVAILLLAVNNIYSNPETCQTNTVAVPYCLSEAASVQADSLLIDIQSKINSAFIKDLMSKSNDALNELSTRLENLYKVRNQNLILYWRSYLLYYSSISYLSKGDLKSAEVAVKEGIELIKSIGKKTSEDYVILAMLQSISIKFNASTEMSILDEVNKNISSAVSLDSTNLRAFYVLGSNDFYTPEEYGGCVKAEKYLLKAISLPSQKINNSYLPSWGKEESYEILIKFYIKKEKWNLAKEYFTKAIAQFPKSYSINQLAPGITGK